MVNLSKIDLKFNTNGIGIGLELGDNKTISQECILMVLGLSNKPVR